MMSAVPVFCATAAVKMNGWDDVTLVSTTAIGEIALVSEQGCR